MASEERIKRMLDVLTTAPRSRIENLDFRARDHAKSIRRIIGTDNVVAVGISEKITKKTPTGKLALTFYVQRKVSPKKLRAELLIPPTVPESLSGPEAIPTDVIPIGKLRPEINAVRTPIQPGNSMGHIAITAGTLGAVVRKGKAIHLLSNSHVLARSGLAKKGDQILYPGKADGGARPVDVVAELSGFKPFVTGGDFVNRADCAIARPMAARRDLVSEIKGLGLPKGTVKPRRGMKVVKVGRTTGKTTGEIRDVNFRFALDYEQVGEVGFIDQVLCTRYTKPGDSGSLVLDKSTSRAVGLHFAGASGGSVFSPIGDVLSALGVKLMTKSISSQQNTPSRRAREKVARRPRAAGRPAVGRRASRKLTGKGKRRKR